jgi:hypothetical protein
MPYTSDESDTSDHSDTESVHSEPEVVNNTAALSEDSDNENTESSTESETKKKLTGIDFLKMYEEKLSDFNDLVGTFLTTEKDFEKQKRDFNSDKKKMEKELNSLFTKLSKKLYGELGKRKKRTGNSKSGFNKVTPVPKKLVKYLDLDDGTEMTRPQITKLLNSKFKADGFKTEDGSKQTVINTSKAAKKLGVSKGHTIEWRKLQTFIAGFYNEEKQALVAN